MTDAMDQGVFTVSRSPFLTVEQLGRIEGGALGLLEQVGIRVMDDRLCEMLRVQGFSLRDGRIRLPRQIVGSFVAQEREQNGNAFRQKSVAPSSARIRLATSPYPQRVHDLRSDRIVPFTRERLIEATKLLDVLDISGPPGCPVDAPPALQPIVQLWISAKYSRHGRRTVDPKSSEAVPFIAEMGELLGDPLRSLPVYVFSPLRLGSESLRCVLDHRGLLDTVHVSSMPSLGSTSPIGVGDAYALAAAETIGSALLLQEALQMPTTWSVGLFAADLRSLMMVFGSPESLLLQLASEEVDAYYHGSEWSPSVANIHTNAKFPGAQACAEKAGLMTTGALLGARRFTPAGTLSLDDVFSAEQLTYDVEIAAHVERSVRGIRAECDPARCVDEVMAGIREKSFVGLDSTVEAFREFYWHPEVFERASFATWQGLGSPTDRERAKERAQELLQGCKYELAPAIRGGLDAIVGRAWEALG